LKYVDISELITITHVSITKDLRHAKVYFSVIGDNVDKAKTMALLEDSAKQITHIASRKVVMRYFPQLQFILDEGVDNQMRVEELLQKITEERDEREEHEQS
jgi:ribosome-binding factor A